MFPTRNGANVIPGLDGLRAVSILCVLVSHLLWVPTFPLKIISRIINPGDLGVRTFFVISGFLITLLLLQEKDRRGSISLRRFYVRRTLRIFPAYYCFLACVFVLAALGVIALQRSDYFYTLTYTFNFKGRQPTWWVGHTWSLAVEEQFYLLWPFVVARFGERTVWRLSVGCFLIGPVGRALLSLTPQTFSDHWFAAFPFVADPIAAGAMLALLWHRPGVRSWLTARGGKWWVWLVPCAVLAIEGMANRSRVFPHPVFLTSVMQPIANIGIVLVVAWAASSADGLFGRFLNSRIMVSMGVLSYSIYLWQMLFLNPTSTSAWLRFPLDLVWLSVAASLSWLLVERPLNAFRRKRSETLAMPPEMATAGTL